MLFHSDEEVQERLNSPNNVLEKRIRDQGRRPGDDNYKPEFRAVVGAMAKVVGDKNAAELFDVSPPSAKNWRDGKIAPAHGVNPELKAEVDSKVSAIQNVALDKLLGAINKVDEGLIKTPKEAASIAKDLATVVEKTREKGPEVQNNNQVILYIPKRDHIDDYPTIDLSKKVS